MTRRRMSVEERFWSYVEKGPGCWRWLAKTDRDGYGRFWVLPKTVRSHRFAWELENGPIPHGLAICHRCDNPTCVRPDHLFLGTNLDNVRDCVRKGRRRYGVGEANPCARLTAEAVVEMRRLFFVERMKQRDIARRFGVSQAAACLAISGQRWRHVSDSFRRAS